MQEIKKVRLIPVAKIAALFGVLLGFVRGILIWQLSIQYAREGIIFSLTESFQYIAMNPTSGVTPFFIAIGWLNIVVTPIIMGVGYFVSGIVLALLFNISTKLVGGVKVEFSENKETKKKK